MSAAMADRPDQPRSHATASVLDQCRELGFALAGVCRAEPIDFGEELRQWLADGRHGEMAYLEQHLEQRLDPRTMLDGARSIICVADRYHRGGRDPWVDPAEQRPPGRVARYARGDDYHKVMKKRLHALCDALAAAHPDAQFKACVDTAPIMEREHAQRAGLGAVGKHTLLIEPGVGSYLLLGEVLATIDLPPTPSAVGRDLCASCTRCIDACPTDAITPWSVDATKCISYLTIEHRGTIDERYHEPIGDWLFGCDICQEVCPHNSPTRRSKAAPVHDAYEPRRRGFDLLDVLGWSEEDRRDAFMRSSMKRAKLDMMKRNALIVAGNVLRQRDDGALRSRIESLAVDENEPPLVQQTARRVLDRLGD